MSRSGIAESHSNPIFRFLRNLILFYIVAASTYIPTNSVGGVPFSPYPLTHFLFVDFLKIYGHSDISVWWHFIVALICISVIIISKVGHLFMCLLVICMFSSEKHLFWSSALFFFFNWIVFFFLFVCLFKSCMSCLYIFETYPFRNYSVTTFANIFCQCRSCLFISFMVSFAMQTLRNLIRFHLFIFDFISIALVD